MLEAFCLEAPRALGTLRRLYTEGASEYVQYHAAATLLDRAGYGQLDQPPEGPPFSGVSELREPVCARFGLRRENLGPRLGPRALASGAFSPQRRGGKLRCRVAAARMAGHSTDR
jgi:hypothetical protein